MSFDIFFKFKKLIKLKSGLKVIKRVRKDEHYRIVRYLSLLPPFSVASFCTYHDPWFLFLFRKSDSLKYNSQTVKFTHFQFCEF